MCVVVVNPLALFVFYVLALFERERYERDTREIMKLTFYECYTVIDVIIIPIEFGMCVFTFSYQYMIFIIRVSLSTSLGTKCFTHLKRLVAVSTRDLVIT